MQWTLGKPLAYMFATEGWNHPRTGRMHQSFDLRAPVGTPAFAAADGTVVFGGNYSDGSGGAVELDHGDFATRYLHLSRVDVAKGARVKQGQRIGLTGYAVSPHLHFDVWALPSVVSSFIAKFGKPLGLGQTKSFAGKLMTKIPVEPLVPSSYQQDVIDGAKKAGVPLYRSRAYVAVSILLLLGAGYAAYRYFKASPPSGGLPA